MTEYTLYLDESEIPIKDDHGNTIGKYFFIGGVAMTNQYHDTGFTTKINELKRKLWDKQKYDSTYLSHILHELEVTHASNHRISKLKFKYNDIFAKYSKCNLLYNSLSTIVRDSDIVVMCAYINENELKRIYPSNKLNDRLSILMQIIIENYYHFLINNNGVGKICYEHIDDGQNKIVKQRYDNIKRTGTMFYPAKEINKCIKDLYFKKKTDNIPGLQLADFVPNTLGRHQCEKDNNSNKMYSSVSSKLYDGNGLNMQSKFGLKEIP